MTTRMIFVPPDALTALIRSMGDQAGDWTPAMADVSKRMADDVIDHFNTMGDGTWPRHAPGTIERWGAHRLMKWKGNLVFGARRYANPFSAMVVGDPHSILHEKGRGRSWRKVKARIGKSRRYAGKEREGERGGTVEMPARPLFYLSDKAIDDSTDIILDWLFKKADTE